MRVAWLVTATFLARKAWVLSIVLFFIRSSSGRKKPSLYFLAVSPVCERFHTEGRETDNLKESAG